jgi:hypothetical protein
MLQDAIKIERTMEKYIFIQKSEINFPLLSHLITSNAEFTSLYYEKHYSAKKLENNQALLEESIRLCGDLRENLETFETKIKRYAKALEALIVY